MAISYQSINFKEKLLDFSAKLIHIIEEFAIYIIAILVLTFGLTLFLSEKPRTDIENADPIIRTDATSPVAESPPTAHIENPIEDSAPTLSSQESGKLFVAVNRLNVRLLPSTKGKIIKVLSHGQTVTPMERRGHWIRISNYYEIEGMSVTVAHWVYASMLSDKSKDTKSNYLSESDDYTQYQQHFFAAANRLIHNGICTTQDFEQSGGWVRAIDLKPEPIYFAHCHQVIRFDKIYLNAETGEVFRD